MSTLNTASPGLLFLHGLESGPHGSKYNALRSLPDIQLVSPDFRGLQTVQERFERVLAVTEGMRDVVVVGSSFGGLMAALLADACPERVAGYVLCAPAFHRAEAAGIQRVPEHVHVIHGSGDTVVPIEASRDFCRRFGGTLEEVDDDHRLGRSVDSILAAVRTMLHR